MPVVDEVLGTLWNWIRAAACASARSGCSPIASSSTWECPSSPVYTRKIAIGRRSTKHSLGSQTSDESSSRSTRCRLRRDSRQVSHEARARQPLSRSLRATRPGAARAALRGRDACRVRTRAAFAQVPGGRGGRTPSSKNRLVSRGPEEEERRGPRESGSGNFASRRATQFNPLLDAAGRAASFLDDGAEQRAVLAHSLVRLLLQEEHRRARQKVGGGDVAGEEEKDLVREVLQRLPGRGLDAAPASPKARPRADSEPGRAARSPRMPPPGSSARRRRRPRGRRSAASARLRRAEPLDEERGVGRWEAEDVAQDLSRQDTRILRREGHPVAAGEAVDERLRQRTDPDGVVANRAMRKEGERSRSLRTVLGAVGRGDRVARPVPRGSDRKSRDPRRPRRCRSSGRRGTRPSAGFSRHRPRCAVARRTVRPLREFGGRPDPLADRHRRLVSRRVAWYLGTGSSASPASTAAGR